MRNSEWKPILIRQNNVVSSKISRPRPRLRLSYHVMSYDDNTMLDRKYHVGGGYIWELTQG